MEVASCTVNLAGNVLHQVNKEVTPAEAQILLHVHGEGSVVNLKRKTNDKRSHREEFERLCDTYREKVVRALFPGLNPSLPITFADASLQVENDVVQQSAERRTRRRRSDVPQHDGDGAEDVTAVAAAQVTEPEAPQIPDGEKADMDVPAFLRRDKKPAATVAA